jgi:hypothetical protein
MMQSTESKVPAGSSRVSNEGPARAAVSGCCGPAEQQSCCAPAAKQACCGEGEQECGCR